MEEPKKALLEVEADETKKTTLAEEVNYLSQLVEAYESDKNKYEYEPDYDTMSDGPLCSESIQFPEIYMRTTSVGKISIEDREEYVNSKENERINQIKEFYNGENTFK